MTLLGINHLAFITPDMVKTIRFYRDLLGMELTTGIGHDGYRHYFFKLGDEATHVAFFEYEGAVKATGKLAGVRTEAPIGFDHVSFTVPSREALYGLKDKLEAAGFEVQGAVDHGLFWSIYFFDPNNIPLEATWQFMELVETPAVHDDAPLDIVAEGAMPQPGHWPDVDKKTPTAEMTSHVGNAHPMRNSFLSKGLARFKKDVSEDEKQMITAQ
jgi:catechol 2,3-dioxygenase-like lactoylglutathione lyase family enzyme